MAGWDSAAGVATCCSPQASPGQPRPPLPTHRGVMAPRGSPQGDAPRGHWHGRWVRGSQLGWLLCRVQRVKRDGESIPAVPRGAPTAQEGSEPLLSAGQQPKAKGW